MKARIIAALAIACLWGILPGAASAQLLTPEGIEELQVLKAQIYPALTRMHARDVAAGVAQPTVYTEVGGGEAPVSYYHFSVPMDRLDALATAIPLPSGFALAPIRVVQDEELVHTITLTVYEVAGERRGLRAEWTTYVLAPGDAKPRVMMLETATSEGSLDPVDLFSDAAKTFEYALTDDTVDTEIVSGSSVFSASLQLPSPPMRSRIVDGSWGATSDIIYWRNGVADLQNVNGLVANREVMSVPPSHVSIDDRTPWAAFVESDPRWVLLFDERIDAVIQPWVNAADPAVSLEPAFRAQLLETKASVFSANELQRAEAIGNRMAEPTADFFVEPTPPSIFLNFEILSEQREALAAAIPLPEGFELAQVQPVRDTEPRYLLSLNIYETQGIAAGLRAEWSVYVTREGDPVPRYMILEAQSSSFSLDPVNEFTDPADVFEYVVDEGVVSVDVQAPGTSFQATFPLPETPQLLATTLSWAEANSIIYWRNGVADKIYFNGLIYDLPVAEVPTQSVSLSDGTVWAPYLRLHQVLVYQNQLEFIASPWNNLNRLELPEPGPHAATAAALGALAMLARRRGRGAAPQR